MIQRGKYNPALRNKKLKGSGDRRKLRALAHAEEKRALKQEWQNR